VVITILIVEYYLYKIKMSGMDLILTIGGFFVATLVTIIGYFLKRTMSELDRTEEELKDVRVDFYKTKSKIDVMEKEYVLKHEHLGEKFDELHEAVKDLIKEIKSLTQELHKKKD